MCIRDRDRPVRRGLVVVVNPAVVVAVPVPVGALAVLRSLVELVFREIGAIAAEVGIVLQGGPGHWIKVLAHSHEAAEAQCTEVRLDLRSPSPRTRLPTPITAKAGPMPTHDRLGTDNRENVQDRREPSIQLDQEPAIVVRQPDPALNLTPQDDQLTSERCVLGFKPVLRLEWRG